MAEHDLKTWPSEWEAIARGAKTFEVRSNRDRDFAVGDVLLLRKYDPASRYSGGLPGRYVSADGIEGVQDHQAATIRARVTYILHGGRFGLPDGVCVMSIRPESA